MSELIKQEREDLPRNIYDILMHKVSPDVRDELLKYITSNNEIMIPISIFKTILPPLEALVRYLKEYLHMTYHEISKSINRDDRTIWVTYRNSLSKYVEFSIDKIHHIPLSVLSDRTFSVLEHLSLHLKNKYGYSTKQIATLLDKDESTIWSVQNRAKKKSKDF
jgi:hypothetical protein